MRSRASSFRADAAARARSEGPHGQRASGRWYRETWPWLLVSGPLVVVVASLVSAWLAIRSDDGVVAEDYYKRGLLINQEIKRTTASAGRNLGARVSVDASGWVRAQLEGADGRPRSLRLRLAHPTRSANDQVVTLARAPNGEYVGRLASETPGRWIVILESDDWRLPTTTVAGPLRELALGTAATHAVPQSRCAAEPGSVPACQGGAQ